jgi:purine nucleosidase
MASALLENSAVAERNVRVVWIGGDDWPVGGWEYNLWNDVTAANVVFRSKVELWQIPSTIYKRMAVSYAELVEKVYDKGPLGKYLVEQLVEWITSFGRTMLATIAEWVLSVFGASLFLDRHFRKSRQ